MCLYQLFNFFLELGFLADIVSVVVELVLLLFRYRSLDNTQYYLTSSFY